MIRISHLALVISLAIPQAACGPDDRRIASLQRTGFIAEQALDEASGIQGSQRNPGVFFVHNDDSDNRVYALSASGADLGDFRVRGAVNRDWEDITALPSDEGPLLALGDVGDNFSAQEHVTLYFVSEPEPGSDGLYSGGAEPVHVVRLSYPDGPRDCESIAWDAYSDRIYLVSKRDVPARIYSIPREVALASDSATLSFDGLMARLRPPSPSESRKFGRRGWQWISQPTGLDIHPDGRRAAVITYRSLYLFERQEHESWPRAFAREPVEFLGPPAQQEEAVAWAPDGESVMITSEKLPAPIFRIRPKGRAPSSGQ
jgi:hypothetical protein